MNKMFGMRMTAVAKEDFTFSAEKWTKGKEYELIYDELGGMISLSCDDEYVSHWSVSAFDIIKDNFDVTKNLTAEPGKDGKCQ